MSTPEDDLFAGEYVLGTLDEGERAAAAARRTADAPFDQAVTDWENRLAPLDEAVPEVDAPPHVWSAILTRLAGLAGGNRFDGRNRDQVVVLALTRRVTRWRQVAAFTTALAAALALWIVIGPIAGGPAKPQMIAVLLKGGDAPAYVMSVSLRNDTVAVRPVSAQPPEGKSYELWVIDPAIGAPRSLGTIDGARSVHKIPATVPRDVIARATYAVTVEPLGGSPTGAPSGAPLFVGHVLDAP